MSGPTWSEWVTIATQRFELRDGRIVAVETQERAYDAGGGSMTQRDADGVPLLTVEWKHDVHVERRTVSRVVSPQG